MKWVLFILLMLLITSEFDEPWQYTISQKPPSSVSAESTFTDALFAPEMLRKFYINRSWKPAWRKNGQLTLQGHTLIMTLRNAIFYGLISDEYHLPLIDSLIREDPQSEGALQLDVYLTDALFKFLSHLQHGRLQAYSASVRSKDHSIDSVLLAGVERAVHTGRIAYVVDHFDRHETEYRALRELLARTLEDNEKYPDSYEGWQSHYEALKKIAANMERWRWEGKEITGRYLLVNIPAFEFHLMEDGKQLLESRVIVGRPDRQTPELSSAIECIIIYPYWNVPQSIAANELLPSIQSNPNYLKENKFDVLDAKGHLIEPGTIDWGSYSSNYFPFRLRQREGEDNALGVIKFQFENIHGVYLHDTNARHLFKKQVRAFSHGCIRAEKSVELAHHLVAYDSGLYTPALLDNVIARRHRLEIPIRRQLPIHIRYFTADAEGIYNDIYKLDTKLIEAFQAYAQPVEVRTHSYLRSFARR